MKDLVARHVLARELGITTQTIAKWGRQNWGFPKPDEVISTRLILYRRSDVETALAARNQHRSNLTRKG